mmetsp:Transcript_25090/g.46225  ORF Transcript_25090/g.46225 Transcript_25090/m.46225 type:complete len:116 (-) Transcript_25090:189-536(-)
MTKFIAIKEYYICVKHNLVSDCYSNDCFLVENEGIDKTTLLIDEQPEDCLVGYCPSQIADECDITDEDTPDEVKPEEEVDAQEVKDADDGGNDIFGHYAGISIHFNSGIFFLFVL